MSDLPGTFVQLLSEVFDAFWLCKKFIIDVNQNETYVVLGKIILMILLS